MTAPVERSSRVVLFGGGGHGFAVHDVLARLGADVRAVVDPGLPRVSTVDRLSTDDEGIEVAQRSGLAAVVAVGDNARRLELLRRLEAAGIPLPAVVGSTATVAIDARLGPGVVVMEHAHVGPGSRAGAGCIVNTAAVVEHDCTLGDGSHCGPRAVLAGGASTGARAFVAAGATVIPMVHIAADAIVGAGSVAIRDVPRGATAVGVPARVVKREAHGA